VVTYRCGVVDVVDRERKGNFQNSEYMTSSRARERIFLSRAGGSLSIHFQ